MATPPTNPNSVEATEETGSVPLARGSQTALEKPEQRQFLRSATRDLSEDELGSAAARRFLIAEIDRLDRECDLLRESEKKYNDLRVSYAEVEALNRKMSKFEILSYFSVSVGSIGIGAAPGFITNSDLHLTGLVILAISILLSLIAVITKVVK